MPEYLAPDVYVEEIDTGSKPIEGVSTSTAGMVGVTERGPVNVPILVTSYGEFTRWFGGELDPAVFVNGSELHCFLPHAVEGFFANGGKRLYVTRVESGAAAHASFGLHDRGTVGGAGASAQTWLLRPAPEASGTTNANALYVVNVSSVVPGVTGALANGDHIRIGGGSDAEYWDVDVAQLAPIGAAVGARNHVTLAFPLARAHDIAAPATNVQDITRVALASGPFNLATPAPAGASSITVTAAANTIFQDDLVEIGTTPANPPIQDPAEYRFVSAVAPGAAGQLVLTLDSPLHRAHTATAAYVTRLSPYGPLANAAAPFQFDLVSVNAAANVITANGVAGINQGDLLEIGSAAGATEFRIAGLPTVVAGNMQVPLDAPLRGTYGPFPQLGFVRRRTAPAGQVTTLEAGRPAAAGDSVAYLAVYNAVFANRAVLIVFDRTNYARREVRRVGQLSVVMLTDSATDIFPAGTVVERMTIANAAVTPNPKATNADAFDGTNVISLDNRVGITTSSLLQIGAGASVEYAAVAQLPDPDPTGGPPDAGLVILGQSLRRRHASGTAVTVLSPPTVDTTRPATATALATAPGASQLVLGDGGDALAAPADRFLTGELVRLTVPGVGVAYNVLAGDAQLADAAPVRLAHALMFPHAAGSPVAERAEMIDVEALDSGGWGNRLRLSVADEPTGAVARTEIITAIGTNRIRLASPTGVEPGTILEVCDNTGATLIATVKVMRIDRATAEATLDAAAQLTNPQLNTINAAPATSRCIVRSREFSLTVRLLDAPDPSDPVRADVVLDTEVFRYLSMDTRHSRYIEKVVGLIGGPPRLSDRRSDGESWYIRVDDLTPNNAVIRYGPEALTDRLANGTTQAARHALTLGNDGMVGIGDPTYIGADNANPENRTGLYSLRNIEDISIVAVPGRTSAQMQNAMINHCELARYRFAVLDAQRPPHDSIADVINQRQQYDTKYAALYHPWLLIPPPFPASASQADEYAIPPSGHIVGVYARTDIERGVHKAPANEVVRNIVGLQRLINKGEHDILNPYPININVIRDFRPNSRGIRVYGGRVITSDSDWKYVNVRRLLIFIEASINRGLQWVVFEPNAEPLWARVTRSISNFLTLVWRNGALEGTKVEEAYFVKCDRTTMTQTDIDSGRLICVVGVAPVKPAEFVIVRIGLWTAHADE